VAVARGLRIAQRKCEERPQEGINDRSQRRVVEHEMDMERAEQRPPALGWLLGMARRLIGPESRIVRPPRRAVEREYEEAWPARD
jgi:hypothetical protein